jgi:hypothetical protein
LRNYMGDYVSSDTDFSEPRNCFRVSTGIVFRFGRRTK